jgi:NitT/TauT family transport system substrate-binding protein
MKPNVAIVVAILVAILSSCGQKPFAENLPLKIGAEFSQCTCAACVAYEKGWYEEEGFEIVSYQSYVTGGALSSAIAEGYVDVAYIGLVPAIIALSKSAVPFKIVSGIYRYGYAFVVNPSKIRDVKDLERHDARFACPHEGSGANAFLQATLETYRLDKTKVMSHVDRMNPHKILASLAKGELDGGFVPEHWVSVAESKGFTVLLTCKDVTPCISGAVLVVRESLIAKHPEAVKRLVQMTVRSIEYVKSNPGDAAMITSRHLTHRLKRTNEVEKVEMSHLEEVTPEMCIQAMKRIEFTPVLDAKEVQLLIDNLHRFRIIEKSIKAEDILDLRFLK